MFKKTRVEEIVNIGYQREPKTWAITVYTEEHSVGVLYKCTSFYLMKYFLVLRTLDSGERHISLNTIWSFTVKEIKEEAND